MIIKPGSGRKETGRMDAPKAMEQLAAWGNEARKKHMRKSGAGENLFGVPLGSLRKFAESIGPDDKLSLSLWETGNADARMLSAMITDPAKFPRDRAERMIKEAGYAELLDELVTGAVAEAPYAAELRDAWLASPDDVEGRVGWTLVSISIRKDAFGPESLTRSIDLVEQGLAGAQPLTQWAMNRAMCEIAIRYDAFTERCVEIGERLGVYKGQKVPKGCTSAYAPDWIAAGVKRRKPAT
jgi:3-methyladenine DNA glycosylase AlkD